MAAAGLAGGSALGGFNTTSNSTGMTQRAAQETHVPGAFSPILAVLGAAARRARGDSGLLPRLARRRHQALDAQVGHQVAVVLHVVRGGAGKGRQLRTLAAIVAHGAAALASVRPANAFSQ